MAGKSKIEEYFPEFARYTTPDDGKRLMLISVGVLYITCPFTGVVKDTSIWFSADSG